MKIILLIESVRHLDVSHALYINALAANGHEVTVGDVNSVGFESGHVTCSAAVVHEAATPYEALSVDLQPTNIANFDLAWMLNRPHREVGESVWQLLWRSNQAVQFVNDVASLYMLNNKNNLPLVVPAANLPESVGSTDADQLHELVESRPGEEWILKDPNGGAGADVFVLKPNDTNVKALIQSMTGNVHAISKTTDMDLVGLQARHAVLQSFVSHSSEKRVAIVAGEVVSAQEKVIAAGDHRGNVSQHATMKICEVTADEQQLAERVGVELARYGIIFAGIDMAFPYLFEVNLVNPGGLVERYQLGESATYLEPLVESIIRATASKVAPVRS